MSSSHDFFRYRGEKTIEGVSAWIERVHGGLEKPVRKSAKKPPGEWKSGDVKTIV
jgi:hypothetical protein